MERVAARIVGHIACRPSPPFARATRSVANGLARGLRPMFSTVLLIRDTTACMSSRLHLAHLRVTRRIVGRRLCAWSGRTDAAAIRSWAALKGASKRSAVPVPSG
eukprot:5598313-Prymnesium_polylepis.1